MGQLLVGMLTETARPSSTDFSGIRSIPDPFVLADQ
jgi:hypothetical protein